MSELPNPSISDADGYEIESDEEVEEAVAETLQPRVRVDAVIEVRRGEELDKHTAYFITARQQSRVIILAGDVGSGKTTLLLSIYEKFRKGVFAGYLFAGSETLMGFERRCWHSRISSGAERPETERTLSGSAGILHLRVRREATVLGEPCDLLMFDLSGEDFREARISASASQRLSELHRTDHFVLLIDGEKLADPMQRHEAVYNSKQLLQRLLHTGTLRSRALVSVLFSKYDAVLGHKQSASIEEFVNLTERRFGEAFSRSVAQLRFFKIAARPETSDLGIAYGVDAIFPLWVEETPFQSTIAPICSTRQNHTREFDRYYERRLPQRFV